MNRLPHFLATGWRRMFDTRLNVRLPCGHTSGRATVLQKVGRPDMTVCGDCYEDASRGVLGREEPPRGGKRGTSGGTKSGDGKKPRGAERVK